MTAPTHLDASVDRQVPGAPKPIYKSPQHSEGGRVSVDWRAATITVGLVCMLSAPLQAQPSCGEAFALTDGPILRTLIPQDDPASWMQPCRNAACRAASDLKCMFSDMAHRDVPNSLAYDTIRERDRDHFGYLARIKAFDRRMAPQGRLVCGWLARIAGRVTGDRRFDDKAVMHVVELAARLDRRGVRCSPQVVAAFPRTPAVHGALAEGAQHCRAGLLARCRHIVATWPNVRPAPPPPMPSSRGTPPPAPP